MDGNQALNREEELRKSLGQFYKVYVEFVSDRKASEKAKVEQLWNRNNDLKRMNERLSKQIRETKSQATKVILKS